MFYYLRDKENKPIVTVCLLQDTDGNTARGIAVCSDLDHPCKATGRAIAEGRARKALKHKAESCHVKRSHVYKQIFKLLPTKVIPFKQKVAFNPSLTAFEEKLLA